MDQEYMEVWRNMEEGMDEKQASSWHASTDTNVDG